MVGIILTELNEEQTKNIQDFFKKNPKRIDCNVEVNRRKYKLKKEEVLKRAKEQKVSDEKMVEQEAKEEEEIAKDGDIMKLVNPEEETEDEAVDEE